MIEILEPIIQQFESIVFVLFFVFCFVFAQYISLSHTIKSEDNDEEPIVLDKQSSIIIYFLIMIIQVMHLFY